MAEIVYLSRASIERKVRSLSVAHLPGEPQEVVFSLHGALAEHYGVPPVKLIGAHSSAIDYMIASTGVSMLATFGSALEARHVNASNGKLVGEVTGEVATEHRVLVVRRIHLAMRLRAPEFARATIEQVFAMYAMRSPLYRTLRKCIALTSSYELVG